MLDLATLKRSSRSHKLKFNFPKKLLDKPMKQWRSLGSKAAIVPYDLWLFMEIKTEFHAIVGILLFEILIKSFT